MQDDQYETPGVPRLALDQTRRFLHLLEPGSAFTFQTFGEGPTRPERLGRVLHGTIDAHEAQLIELNHSGAGIFVMVNAGDGEIKQGAATCRTTANVIAIRALFVDLDGAPITPVLTAIVPPDWVVQSSPGRWHAYWKVTNCPLSEFTAAQTALAARFDGDPSVKDLPRVMRVPGFLHQKGTPFASQLYLPKDYSCLMENECD